MLVSKIKKSEESLCVCVCVCVCDKHSNLHTSVHRDDENSCAAVTIIPREIPINADG